MNTARKSIVDGELAPGRNDEYLLYQTLLGAWPFDPSPEEFAVFRERSSPTCSRRPRRPKVNTSWVNPNEEYEEATRRFRHAGLRPMIRPIVPARLHGLAATGRVVRPGERLSQIRLKLTSPGVPDIYQGQELWEFSLVDPDNRRAVDYDHRRESVG